MQEQHKKTNLTPYKVNPFKNYKLIIFIFDELADEGVGKGCFAINSSDRDITYKDLTKTKNYSIFWKNLDRRFYKFFGQFSMLMKITKTPIKK